MEQGPQRLPTATVLPVFAWLKTPEVGVGGLTTLRGLKLFALCACFFFVHPPSCAAVIASSLLLPAATERERHRKT